MASKQRSHVDERELYFSATFFEDKGLLKWLPKDTDRHVHLGNVWLWGIWNRTFYSVKDSTAAPARNSSNSSFLAILTPPSEASCDDASYLMSSCQAAFSSSLVVSGCSSLVEEIPMFDPAT